MLPFPVDVGTVEGIPDLGLMCSRLFRATPQPREPDRPTVRKQANPKTGMAGTLGANRPDPHNATKPPQRPPTSL